MRQGKLAEGKRKELINRLPKQGTENLKQQYVGMGQLYSQFTGTDMLGY